MRCSKCGSINVTVLQPKDGKERWECLSCGHRMIQKLNSNEDIPLAKKEPESTVPVALTKKESTPESEDEECGYPVYDSLFPKLSDEFFNVTGIDINDIKIIAKARVVFNSFKNSFKAWIKQPLSIAASIIIVAFTLNTAIIFMDAILSPDSQSNPSTYNNSNEDSTIIDNIQS